MCGRMVLEGLRFLEKAGRRHQLKLIPGIVGIGGTLREYDDPGCGVFCSAREIAEIPAKNRHK
jgi:hypothetical protein